MEDLPSDDHLEEPNFGGRETYETGISSVFLDEARAISIKLVVLESHQDGLRRCVVSIAFRWVSGGVRRCQESQDPQTSSWLSPVWDSS